MAIVLLVAVGFAVPVARGLLDDGSDRRFRGDTWERLPRPPANDVLRGPELGSAVWTGRELILLAEFAYSPPIPSGMPPDGLAYNPATGRWRALPEPPPDQSATVGRQGSVWTGKEVILLYAAGAPLAYDPDANTWRRVAHPPTGVISHAADPAPIWTGAEVLVWEGLNVDDTSGKTIDGGRGAAYNPATDRWRRLPRSPLSNRTWAIQAWTGRLLLVVAGSCGDAGQIRCQDGAAYDPAANAWTTIPALADGAIAPEAAPAWTGSELIIWSATTRQDGLRIRNTASAYNPHTRRWRTLPPAPITPRRLAAVVWAGDRLLVWGGLRHLPGGKLAYPDDGAAYHPRSNRWQPLAKAPVPGRAAPLTVWMDDRASFIGGMNLGDQPRTDRGNLTAITEQGAAYRPAGLQAAGSQRRRASNRPRWPTYRHLHEPLTPQDATLLRRGLPARSFPVGCGQAVRSGPGPLPAGVSGSSLNEFRVLVSSTEPSPTTPTQSCRRRPWVLQDEDVEAPGCSRPGVGGGG